MGARGPRRTPSSILQQRGSQLAGRSKDEPIERIQLPPCPRWVNERAREYWDEIAPQLHAIGLLTASYAPALALLCNALGDYVYYDKKCQQNNGNGWYTISIQGGEKISPAARLKNEAWEKALKAMTHFGMTAASRSGMSVKLPSTNASGTNGKILRLA